MTKRYFWLSIFLLVAVATSAQKQQGFVKTIGRPNKPGFALGNVTIRVRGMVSAVLTSERGEFWVNVIGKKDGDPIVLLSVRKNGYELKDKGLIGRSLVFSTQVPLEILMVDTHQLAVDKKRIEEKAYRVAEKNYQKRMKEIEEQKNSNIITAEKYRQELKSLQDKYENYLSLISDMADRYARTDYDQLDSLDREINICIENGELDRADSLIHTVFDPETVLDKNRAAKKEIQDRIAFAQKIIDKANADKEAIKRDMDYAERVVVLCKNLANEYVLQGDQQKAVVTLEKALEIENFLHGEESDKVREIIHQIDSLQL